MKNSTSVIGFLLVGILYVYLVFHKKKYLEHKHYRLSIATMNAQITNSPTVLVNKNNISLFTLVDDCTLMRPNKGKSLCRGLWHL